MTTVTFDPSVGGNGLQVSDQAGEPNTLVLGGHRQFFVPALQQTVAVAGNVTTKAQQANTSATQAAASASSASSSAIEALASKSAAELAASQAITAKDQAVIAKDTLYSDLISTDDPSKGSALVGFRQSGSTVPSTVAKKLNEVVSVKDFGAVGDGVSDDSSAIVAAVQYIESTGRNVYVPPGVYLTEPFTLSAPTYASQGSFYGDDRTRCVFKRKTPGNTAFVTFGSSQGTIFRSHVGMTGIKIDGGEKTNGPAVEAFSLSRSVFTDCHFTGGTCAFRLFGGVSNFFNDCLFDMADRGIHIQDYEGGNPNKWPNLTRISGGQIVDNSEYGVWFDGGVMLIMDSVDIEGNGSSRSAENGGIYVGPNVGTALSTTSGDSPGLILRSCWVERNKGIAQIYCESGINQFLSSFFFANGTEYVEYDIRVVGGRYTVKGCDFVFFGGKIAQVSEGPGILAGNFLEVQPSTTLDINPSKTCVNTGNAFSVFGGRFPAVYGATNPLFQQGTDQTGLPNPLITFEKPFKVGTTPRVFCQTTSNAQLTIYSVDVYGVSSTGFYMRKKQFNGTSVSEAPSLEVRWFAVGEAA